MKLRELEETNPVAFHGQAARWFFASRKVKPSWGGGAMPEHLQDFFRSRHYEVGDVFVAPWSSEADAATESAFRHLLSKGDADTTKVVVCFYVDRDPDRLDPPETHLARLATAAKRVDVLARCPGDRREALRVGLSPVVWLAGLRARVSGTVDAGGCSARGFVLTFGQVVRRSARRRREDDLDRLTRAAKGGLPG